MATFRISKMDQFKISKAGTAEKISDFDHGHEPSFIHFGTAVSPLMHSQDESDHEDELPTDALDSNGELLERADDCFDHDAGNDVDLATEPLLNSSPSNAPGKVNFTFAPATFTSDGPNFDNLFGYFVTGPSKNWAGPGHWKLRRQMPVKGAPFSLAMMPVSIFFIFRPEAGYPNLQRIFCLSRFIGRRIRRSWRNGENGDGQKAACTVPHRFP
jgi:hypothetical protein